MERLRRWMPTPETLRNSRWLRWLGPALHHPRLWHMSRRGVALGLALGVFFGLLIPFAQIPFSAAAAVALRANVPVAVASTLVTNPVTFGPLYYAAWRLGHALIGDDIPADAEPPPLPAPEDEPDIVRDGLDGWFSEVWERLRNVGKPLLLGLLVMATVFGLSTYVLVSQIWRFRIWWTRRQRLRQRERDREHERLRLRDQERAADARHAPD
jgi:uncharacterized protein (DUF2062 family)